MILEVRYQWYKSTEQQYNSIIVVVGLRSIIQNLGLSSVQPTRSRAKTTAANVGRVPGHAKFLTTPSQTLSSRTSTRPPPKQPQMTKQPARQPRSAARRPAARP